MAVGYLVVALVAAAVAVFALQNVETTSVRFLVWAREGVPVAALVLICLGAGLVAAGVPLLIQRWRLRARVRALEARLAILDPPAEPPAPPRHASGS